MVLLIVVIVGTRHNAWSIVVGRRKAGRAFHLENVPAFGGPTRALSYSSFSKGEAPDNPRLKVQHLHPSQRVRRNETSSIYVMVLDLVTLGDKGRLSVHAYTFRCWPTFFSSNREGFFFLWRPSGHAALPRSCHPFSFLGILPRFLLQRLAPECNTAVVVPL